MQRPKDSDGKRVWAAYAVSLGLNVPSNKTKDQIKTMIHQTRPERVTRSKGV